MRPPYFFILFVLTCCFFSTAQAVYSCKDIFTSPRTLSLPVNPSLSIRPRRPVSTEAKKPPRIDIQNDSAQISRDAELLKELIQNKKFVTLSSVGKDGKNFHWFLSLSENGRVYRVVYRKKGDGSVLDMFADKPSPEMENLYYAKISDHLLLEPYQGVINLPRKGRRNLVIDPKVLVKLAVKHDLSVEILMEALYRIPKGVEYRPNKASAYQGRDSFLFFLDIGQRNPLEVVILFKDNTYFLVTAFVPQVYHER